MTTTPTDRAPMALTGEWEAYRAAALDWIARQVGPWTADDLAESVPAARPAWPGEVMQTASRRRLITRTGWCEPSRRASRKGSLMRVWQTRQKETP